LPKDEARKFLIRTEVRGSGYWAGASFFSFFSFFTFAAFGAFFAFSFLVVLAGGVVPVSCANTGMVSENATARANINVSSFFI